jgi:hypothetical protein
MKRRLPGLSQAALLNSEVPDGLYLVQVEQFRYRWHKQKPYYAITFSVLEPKQCAGTSLSGRLYATAKALWKLAWFLRDFGYDAELLGRDELEERALLRLRGVVKISHTVVSGRTYSNLDGFAPAGQWDEVVIPAAVPARGVEPEERTKPEVA